MPYIGRNHVAGDHTSNFKVLDDISSYTATFNGSLATTDWSQGDDVPVRIKTAYQAYRQALRDLPANQTPVDNELSNITWPTKPS